MITSSIKRLKITVLVENRVYSSGLVGEHGISLYLEIWGIMGRKKKFLFDTGQTGDPLILNAKYLNLNLTELDGIIISHGHYDHTGGLKHVLNLISKEITIYLHPDALKIRYKDRDKPQSIGIPFKRKELEKLGAVFCFIKQPTEIFDGVYLTGQIERTQPDNAVGFYIDQDGTQHPDRLYDDQSVIANIKHKGMMIITGCSHSGLMNITRTTEKLGKTIPLYGILGGFHLNKKKSEYATKTLNHLKKYDLKIIAPAHCTDFWARQQIQQTWPLAFRDVYTGESFEV